MVSHRCATRLQEAASEHEYDDAKLQGKEAVITRSTNGIGLAAAQRFVAEGAYVFVTGRREDALDAAVAQIGRNVSAVQGDVSNLDDFDRLYRTVAAEKGMVGLMGLPGHTVKGERDE